MTEEWRKIVYSGLNKKFGFDENVNVFLIRVSVLLGMLVLIIYLFFYKK